MNRGSFAKVYRSLWDGTLAQQPDAWPTFLFLLAHADADGIIEMTHAAIAARSGFTIDAVRRAIELLEAPDSESRTAAHEGRRLMRLNAARSWGWHITNYAAYRAQTEAERAASYRRRQLTANGDRHAPSRTVTPHHQAEGEAEGEADKDTPAPALPMPSHATPRSRARETAHAEHPDFADFYSAYARPVARPKAAEAFRRALGRHPGIASCQLVAAARQHTSEVQGFEPRYIPYPEKWLDEDRFIESLEKLRRDNVQARRREAERRARADQPPPTAEQHEFVRGLLKDLENNLGMNRAAVHEDGVARVSTENPGDSK